MWRAFTTGKRRGDLCGLRWTDVDLESGLATFGPAIKQAGTEIYTGDPRASGTPVSSSMRNRSRCRVNTWLGVQSWQPPWESKLASDGFVFSNALDHT